MSIRERAREREHLLFRFACLFIVLVLHVYLFYLLFVFFCWCNLGLFILCAYVCIYFCFVLLFCCANARWAQNFSQDKCIGQMNANCKRQLASIISLFRYFCVYSRYALYVLCVLVALVFFCFKFSSFFFILCLGPCLSLPWFFTIRVTFFFAVFPFRQNKFLFHYTLIGATARNPHNSHMNMESIRLRT